MKINDKLYKIARIPLTFLIRILIWVKLENKEVLNDGPILIVANHRTFLDPIMILSATKRTIHFFSKIELVKGWKRYLFDKTGLIPVDRKAKNPESIKIASNYLKNGELVGIYPEATRNYSEDKLLPMKAGAAILALETGVPVVLAIQTGKVRLFNRKLKLRFSEKIYLKDLTVDEAMAIIKREMEKLITDRGK